jgi:FtsP/CotA-like multicopper oxidase with cupredoxin domain
MLVSSSSYSPSRRAVLGAGLGLLGATALTGCSSASRSGGGSGPALVSPSGPQVAATEAKRQSTGRSTEVQFTAAAGMVDLGGLMVNTFSYGNHVPAPTIRLGAGDTLVARVANHLPATTSVHWHGVALRNDMDGVPPVTQRAIATGAEFTYRFTAANPGTYWFHPHVGVQLDRGLYGALIVEDPREPLSYDDEWVVVLDDWLDGVNGATPDQVYAGLGSGMAGMGTSPSASMPGMPGMSGPASPYLLSGAASALLGGDAGDVKYPYYLVNGRIAANPEVYASKPGKRIRIRMINAGGDTAFRVALGGHRLTITHTDGYPVRQQQVDAVLIAPGERYDVLVTLGDGVFPLTALAEGKNAAARALVRTGPGATPPENARPAELGGMLVAASQLRATDDVRLTAKAPDVTHTVELTGGMGSYNWSLNGIRFDMSDPAAHPFTVHEGQRVRLRFTNRTTMWHPMHLHGHTFQLGPTGPRKDTALVLPGRTVTCDVDADNPGRWLLHCHNVYHGEAGMMGLLGYLA